MANVSKAEAFLRIFNLFSASVFSIRYSQFWVWGLWFSFLNIKTRTSSAEVVIRLSTCEPPLRLVARWQAWMETTASPATPWWRCWGSTATAWWPCWRPSSMIRCSTGGWWTVRDRWLRTNQKLSCCCLPLCSALVKTARTGHLSDLDYIINNSRSFSLVIYQYNSILVKVLILYTFKK